jgi:tetratricopeptide (TPR) repeat protein
MERRALYTKFLERCRSNGNGWMEGALAYLAADAGDFNRALILMEAFARRPDERYEISAALGLSRLLLAVRESRQALATAEQGLRSYSSLFQRSRLENVRGLALEREGRPEEVAAAFRLALSHGPTVAANYYNLGQILLRLERHIEACTALAIARRLNPRLPPTEPCPKSPQSYQDGWLHRLDSATKMAALAMVLS